MFSWLLCDVGIRNTHLGINPEESRRSSVSSGLKQTFFFFAASSRPLRRNGPSLLPAQPFKTKGLVQFHLGTQRGMTRQRTSGWTGLDGAAFCSISHDETASILQDNPPDPSLPSEPKPSDLDPRRESNEIKREENGTVAGCRSLGYPACVDIGRGKKKY